MPTTRRSSGRRCLPNLAPVHESPSAPVNDFHFFDDRHGARCPFHGHIRKVNPRNLGTDQGPADRTLLFHVLRRGIPYGPPYEPGSEGADRGLLFLAYQTSFTQQFNLARNAVVSTLPVVPV